MKKAISVLAALALLLCAAPASAKTDDFTIIDNWHMDFRDRNKSCSNEEMGWKWNARSRTLTLEDFRVQVPEGEMERQAAVFLPEKSTIELVGESNEIHARSYDCTPIYCEGRLTFTGKGSLKITTDSRAASGIFVEHGPLIFSESVEVTFDPAGYIFTLNDVKGGEAVLSVRDKAKVIFPDDNSRAIAVTHDSSVKSKSITYDYDQDIDREKGTVTLLKNSAKPAAEYSESPETIESQNSVSHEYRFTTGSPILLRDGAAVTRLDASPYLSGGRTMLPLTALEAVTLPASGKTLDIAWDAENRAVSVSCQDADGQSVQTARFTVGGTEMICNGERVPLSAPAALKDGRAFLSVKDFANMLQRMQVDCEIRWDSAAKAAVLIVRGTE